MSNYVHGTDYTRTLNKFEYHLKNMDCNLCQYWRGKKKGCSRAICCCEPERPLCKGLKSGILLDKGIMPLHNKYKALLLK